MDALDFDPPIRVNAPAWINGVPPPSDIDPIETMTLAEVFSLVGVPLGTAAETRSPDAPLPLVLVIFGLGAGVLAAAMLLGRRRAKGLDK